MSLVSLILAFFMVVCVGCQEPVSQPSLEREQSRLRQLAIMYGQFLRRNDGRLPQDESEFRQYVSTHGKHSLTTLGLEVDDLFTSPRDGKPYIIFSVAHPPPDNSGYVAHEQNGKNGARLVASDVGDVSVMGAEEFRERIVQE